MGKASLGKCTSTETHHPATFESAVTSLHQKHCRGRSLARIPPGKCNLRPDGVYDSYTLLQSCLLFINFLSFGLVLPGEVNRY